jgi:uncharacterized protein
MRVLLDTNIWISGLLWGGIPNQVVRLARSGQITVIVSSEILNELQSTLGYPKLQAQLSRLGETSETLFRAIEEVTECVIAETILVPELRDPKDAIVLAAALAGVAEVIVTGDQDLLVLERFQGVEILTPTDFLGRYF